MFTSIDHVSFPQFYNLEGAETILALKRSNAKINTIFPFNGKKTNKKQEKVKVEKEEIDLK